MSEQLTGRVFDFQRYSIHDGTGIRTLIFMKGCPLRCRWCSNPEGLELKPNMMFVQRLCYGCGRCAAVCPTQATTIQDGQLIWDKTKCNDCMACTEVCKIVHARQIAGKEYTIDELIEIIDRDSSYYWRTNGGVTFGGGEPSMQAPFVAAVMQEAKKRLHINTAVETCSYATRENADLIYRNADQIMTDIKHMDEKTHMSLTGVSNKRILDNIRYASEILDNEKQTLTIRIPVIPGLNDSDENIRNTAQFAASLGNVRRLELLPYHNLGEVKYSRVRSVGDYALSGLDLPENADMDRLREIVENSGMECKVGSL